jgi:hypothetical protein
MFYNDGACALKLFDGRPTEDDCAGCMHYRGKDRGLGDKVHNVIAATGISTAVKKITGGRDCGCGKRRAALNKAFPNKEQD